MDLLRTLEQKVDPNHAAVVTVDVQNTASSASRSPWSAAAAILVARSATSRAAPPTA